MPWRVALNPEPEYLEAQYSGEVTAQELTDAASVIATYLPILKPLRLLADCSAIQVSHTAFDLFELANWFSADPARRTIREAVVVPATTASDAIENVRFWETVCSNRGLAVRAFADRESALAWLLEE